MQRKSKNIWFDVRTFLATFSLLPFQVNYGFLCTKVQPLAGRLLLIWIEWYCSKLRMCVCACMSIHSWSCRCRHDTCILFVYVIYVYRSRWRRDHFHKSYHWTDVAVYNYTYVSIILSMEEVTWILSWPLTWNYCIDPSWLCLKPTCCYIGTQECFSIRNVMPLYVYIFFFMKFQYCMLFELF